MTRQEASFALREELNKHGLSDWSVRLNQNADTRFLGLCLHKDKTIVLSAHHIDIHPTPDVINTIRHEIAHALTPGEGHNELWSAKAKEIGCDNTAPCSNLSLSPDIIDAIRSGATVEVTFDEQIIRTPKYNVTRLQDKCEVCGKVAKSVSENTIIMPGDTTPDMKIINLECGHAVVRKIPKGTPFHTFHMGGSPDCNHQWNKNKCESCGRARPYDFQLDGMKFGEVALSVNNGVAFFDEMGLGKTIQAMGVVYFNQSLWPTLWIVKSGLKYQFASAIINWMNGNGDTHIPQIINSSKDWLIPGLKHYIVGYDMLVPKVKKLKSGKTSTSGFDITQFERVGIKCVVLDECQQIKNVDSSRTQMVRRVAKGRKVIALSGTPWKNRGSELFPVLNMMDPMKFHSEAHFRREWVSTYYQGPHLKEGGIRNPEKFKKHVKDLCIRRERTEVMKELPLVNRTKCLVQMDLEQEKVYDTAVDEFVKWYEEQQSNITSMVIIAMMAKMRHLVALAKIPTTIDYVDEFVEDTDRKLVIFTHHVDVAELIHDELKTKYGNEMPVFHLKSELNGAQRFEMQEQFNSSSRAIMVASQLAAGEGLNLQTCSDCIMHERQWNPANEEQCEGRFIRIGQTATSVNAVYTQMEGLTAIDSKLDEIVENKRRWFHSAMNKGEAIAWNQDSIIRDLAESIVRAHKSKSRK
jgi:superfamily II DNA or RNA helicase